MTTGNTIGYSGNPVTIRLISASGQLFQSYVLKSNSGSLDVSGYSTGVYFMEVLDNEKILTSNAIVITH